MMNKQIRQATLTWLLLITLTVISVLSGQFFNQPAIIALTIMSIVVIKGQQIIDVFMGLANAPGGWRLLILSYAVIVPLLTCIISCLF